MERKKNASPGPERRWEKFLATGRVEDYLSYRREADRLNPK